MAIKVAKDFDNFNGAAELSGWTVAAGTGANSTSWASEGTHSIRLQPSGGVDGRLTKSIDFGSSNEIFQLELDVYLATLGTFTVEIGATTVATINTNAGTWQTVRIDSSSYTGIQTVTLRAANTGTSDVYIDSIKYLNNAYTTPYAQDPVEAINFNGENGLQGIAKLANFSVVSSTDKSYDWDVRDLEDRQSWNITQPLQLSMLPSLGSSTSVETFGTDMYTSNIKLNKSSKDIINRVVVYGAGDGVFKKRGQAQDATSITTYGVRMPENPPSFPSINDETQLQKMAEDIVALYKDPVVRILTDIQIPETRATLGDVVKLVDSKTGLNEDARVKKITYTYQHGGVQVVKIDVTNTLRSIEGEQIDLQRNRNILNTAQKGAVNMYMTGETQNVDESHPCEIEFYIPPNVNNINRIDLNYSVEKYRTFQGQIPEDLSLSTTVSNIKEYKVASTSGTPKGIVSVSPNPSPENPVGMVTVTGVLKNNSGSTITGSGVTIALYNYTLSAWEVITGGAWSLPDDSQVFFDTSFIPANSSDYQIEYGGSGGQARVQLTHSTGNIQNSTLQVTATTQALHNHDVFPVIEDIAKPDDIVMNIEIGENTLTPTDRTSALEALYGTLHTTDVSAASSQTTYDLSQVDTFTADNWYTVSIKPVASGTVWLDCDTTTGATVADVFSGLTTDAVIKTQGTHSLKFTQSTATKSVGEFAIDSSTATGSDLNFTPYRYITFDLYLPTTAASLDISQLVAYIPTQDSTVVAGSRPQPGDVLWIIDKTLANLASGWNTGITLDLQGDTATGIPTELISASAINQTTVRGFVLRLFTGATGAASTQDWRVDNIKYKSDGRVRIRGDIFNEFYLETGGTV